LGQTPSRKTIAIWFDLLQNLDFLQRDYRQGRFFWIQRLFNVIGRRLSSFSKRQTARAQRLRNVRPRFGNIQQIEG